MWCKWCEKYVRSISHFAKKHKSELAETRARARRTPRGKHSQSNPRRPPKKWFNACVKSVSKNPEVDNPEALCGWIWHHWMIDGSKRRALMLE